MSDNGVRDDHRFRLDPCTAWPEGSDAGGIGRGDTLARQFEGCRAFVVAADPLEDDLVNVHERWDSEAALLAFRGSGPDTDLMDMIVGAEVQRYEIASIGPA